jgi:hypothetical protein
MNSLNLPEAKLAWILWNTLQQLSDRLWDCYDNDFVSFAIQDNDQLGRSDRSDTGPIDQSSP